MELLKSRTWAIP